MVAYQMGDIEQAQLLLDELVASQDFDALDLALEVSAWMGQIDLAFELLGRLTDQLGQDIDGHIFNPVYRKLHTDPRWGEWRDSLGMSEARLDSIKFEVQLPDK